VTGYAVGLPHHTAKDGGIVWYGGGKLAADLTLPKLRRRWDPARRPTTEYPGAFRCTVPERNAIYQHAARQAATATEHIRRCARSDPGQAADAAWAVADTLHVAARAQRNPALRRAADSYDRAARAQYGRIPRRTSAGSQLRSAARLMALFGDLNGGVTLATAALIANLAALVIAVAELREAQHHAAQAAAARVAASHLHAVTAEARPAASRASQVQTPQHSRPATAAGVARSDFRGHTLPGQLPPADPGRLHPRPRGRPLPPKRAGPRR
jgi:hypothetical protein